jgi:hypothetical protein
MRCIGTKGYREEAKCKWPWILGAFEWINKYARLKNSNPLFNREYNYLINVD